MRSNTLTNEDLQALELLTGSSNAGARVVDATNGAPAAKPTVDLEALTQKAANQ